jgi:hypothetical protein
LLDLIALSTQQFYFLAVETMAPIRSFAGKLTHAAFTLQSAPRHKTALHTASAISADIETSTAPTLSNLCHLFSSPQNNLYLSDSPFGRGVFVNETVSKNELILSIPISNCFRDDEPPDWFERFTEDDDVTDYERYDQAAWAIRLAASLIDMDLEREDDTIDEDVKRGREIWKSLLPDRNVLRASLPVHWSEDLIASAKCTALEVAVDNAYFSRGNAVMAISDKLRDFLGGGIDEDELKQKCEDALDMVSVQTSYVLSSFCN